MTSAELERIHTEISKLIADTGKLNAENRKMSRGLLVFCGSGLAGVVATITTLLIKSF